MYSVSFKFSYVHVHLYSIMYIVPTFLLFLSSPMSSRPRYIDALCRNVIMYTNY